MNKWIAAALPALALLSACAGSSSPKTEAALPPAKPALWKLADADTTIYLFGTIHLLPKDYKWRSAAFDRAAASADSLVLEVHETGGDKVTAEVFGKLAITPGLPPLSERVAPDKREALAKMVAKTGLPDAALNQFESWAAAIALAGTLFADLGLSADNGVEKQLTAQFVAAKKPIAGLETSAQQLGFFDTLPEQAQRTFLTSMVDESANARVQFDQMIGAWSRGDDKAIALTFDDELSLSPELAEALLRNRNKNWTGWLVKRLDTPGTVLVAVGAGHLAGDDSVQSMLAKRGVKVKRIQ
jgi:uncharacterized protein